MIEITPEWPMLRKMRFIVAAVADKHMVGEKSILGACRLKEIVAARFEAIYLIRETTGASYPQIGRFFGGRDHSSCIYAYRTHAAKMAAMCVEA